MEQDSSRQKPLAFVGLRVPDQDPVGSITSVDFFDRQKFGHFRVPFRNCLADSRRQRLDPSTTPRAKWPRGGFGEDLERDQDQDRTFRADSVRLGLCTGGRLADSRTKDRRYPIWFIAGAERMVVAGTPSGGAQEYWFEGIHYSVPFGVKGDVHPLIRRIVTWKSDRSPSRLRDAPLDRRAHENHSSPYTCARLRPRRESRDDDPGRMKVPKAGRPPRS
jgi:hypothetical protein